MDKIKKQLNKEEDYVNQQLLKQNMYKEYGEEQKEPLILPRVLCDGWAGKAEF